MMCTRRKAQAALEYLFTYGWAFFAILLALGALMYFGFLDFDRLRGSECVFPVGAVCEEFYVGPGIDGSPNLYEARIILRNAYGVDIQIQSMSMSDRIIGDDRNCFVDGGSFPHPWNRDTLVEFVCPISADSYIRRQRYDITFTGEFNQFGPPPSLYRHELVGWVSTNAQ